jgi:hypothetical protein
MPANRWVWQAKFVNQKIQPDNGIAVNRSTKPIYQRTGRMPVPTTNFFGWNASCRLACRKNMANHNNIGTLGGRALLRRWIG